MASEDDLHIPIGITVNTVPRSVHKPTFVGVSPVKKSKVILLLWFACFPYSTPPWTAVQEVDANPIKQKSSHIV